MNDIVVFGHPSLTSKSENIINIDDYVVNLSKKMIDIMYAAPGVGLAAPQIGINKNIFVFDAGDGPKVAINPKLVKTEGSIVFMEGCLSLPGYFAEIERPAECQVKYIDYFGKKKEMKASGILSTCIQHEIDHLDGILFIDYLSKLKRDMILKKLVKHKK